jgi:prophage antirepressor-like protein
MKFEKRNFMGIELDVLVGHPEHDLIFVGQQIARAAGLKDPSESVRHERLKRHAGMQLAALRPLIEQSSCSLPTDSQGRRMRSTSVLFTEAEVYVMLLRGHAPASEPFRKWVTEEVLPSIRKTGKYSAAESDHPIAQEIMDRLMSLEGIVIKQAESIQALRQELQAKTFSLEAPVAAEVSPYEGQPGVALCDPAGFNVRTYRELARSAAYALAFSVRRAASWVKATSACIIFA